MATDLELDRPFFARKLTKSFIDKVAHMETMCVFAGAGVTIDRTGLSWDDLAAHLLSKVGTQLKDAKRLVAAVGPERAGSVAVERYSRSKGKNWRLAIGNDLRAALYQNRDWLAGRLSNALAEMWLEFANGGRAFEIFTTNFDEHIELDIQNALRIWRGLLKAKGEEVTSSVPDPKVEHLHGRIPMNDKIVGTLVVSEGDYLQESAQAEQRLAEAFAGKNVLILGSGLNDRPLLNSLWATRDEAQAGSLARIAILPRTPPLDTSKEARDTIRAHEDRLRTFGLQGLFADHYSQIAQFLAEVRVASALDAGAYPASNRRHGDRLGKWWTRWSGSHRTPETYNSSQDAHHRALLICLEDIRKALSAAEEELKVELWLRWEPSTTNRRLRLWASSFARYTDWSMTRDAPIEANSGNAAVNAFCRGRAVYVADPEATGRWKSFLAIPVEATGEINLVVGSLVIASMEREDDSCLSESLRGEHADALVSAREVAQQLAGLPDV